jgi:hypothetical protein
LHKFIGEISFPFHPTGGETKVFFFMIYALMIVRTPYHFLSFIKRAEKPEHQNHDWEHVGD